MAVPTYGRPSDVRPHAKTIAAPIGRDRHSAHMRTHVLYDVAFMMADRSLTSDLPTA